MAPSTSILIDSTLAEFFDLGPDAYVLISSEQIVRHAAEQLEKARPAPAGKRWRMVRLELDRDHVLRHGERWAVTFDLVDKP